MSHQIFLYNSISFKYIKQEEDVVEAEEDEVDEDEEVKVEILEITMDQY